MAGFFDTAVQPENAVETVVAPTTEQPTETAETASVSAFFALPTAEADTSDIVIIGDDDRSAASEDETAVGTETDTPPSVVAPADDEPASGPDTAVFSLAANTESDESDTDAGAIILEAIVKMTALHDRSAAKRDSIMAEVEDINTQIATLKDKAKERTGRAKDIAAEMKKIEDSIAVLQTQKTA